MFKRPEPPLSQSKQSNQHFHDVPMIPSAVKACAGASFSGLISFKTGDIECDL